MSTRDLNDMAGTSSNENRLQRLAELTLRVGAGLVEGQTLLVDALIEHAPFVRVLVKVAYVMGARYVDVQYDEPHARHARLVHGTVDALQWIPPWLDDRLNWCVDHQAAHVHVVGDTHTDLLADVDPVRVALDRTIYLPGRGRVSRSGDANWTVVPCPSEVWASSVYGAPDVDALWGDIETFMRLDKPDPGAAWKDHIDKLESRAQQMNIRRFDALHFEGPATDLTIGLLKESRWRTVSFTTRWGRKHVANLPTEEILTTPDRRRTEGTVQSTRPLALAGTFVRDLELTFREGRVTEVRATEGKELVEGKLETDGGAPFLGEVALVDRSSPIGRSGRTYFNTLLDENATCHIAYGAGYPQCIEGGIGLSSDGLRELGVNQSLVHTDLMIGGPEITVTGIQRGGRRVIVIENDAWQLS